MTPAERLYWTGGAADLTTTAVGLEQCSGGREANPLLTLAGDDTVEVVLSGAVVKAAFWAIFRNKPRVMQSVGIMQFAVAGLNAGTIAGCD